MPFHLYNSNRLENLASALAELCRRQPLPPMTPEIIVVQSGGMARWLNFRFAEHLGVSANLDCPFPNGFQERIVQQVMPGSAGEARLSQPVLHWSLMKIIPLLAGNPGFEALDRYLADGSDLKIFQLAGRLADLFDQYLIFRPDLIAAWEGGRDDSWQALLWREVLARAGVEGGVAHRGHLRDRLLTALNRPDLSSAALPSRFSVFGLSSLPPFHLQVFNALARHVDVHFFFLNPCRQYWGDILPAKAIGRLAGGDRVDELHLDNGNRLLAALGQQGRELFGQLLECEISREYELFGDPGTAPAESSSLLALMQSEILDLREEPAAGAELRPEDRSIQVHCCHSPMRELEVLHDQLLALFEMDTSLEPREVLVMTPDIESYSALIQAVFGSRTQQGLGIPFRIADRFISNEGELVGSFLALLKMAGSRMEISRVLAFLDLLPVQSRFELSAEEVELCSRWLTEVNVRWGIDENDRRELGLPATRENTWRFGLERLLLGYAMRGRGGPGFASILPYDNLEGGETVVLGKFLDFSERLFAITRELPGRRSLRQWSDLLLRLSAEILAVENYRDNEWRFLAEVLRSLAEGEEKVGYGEPVTFEVVCSWLEQACRADRLTAGFLAGGVTFCELLPMRAVPFKVICLLGLNDGAFPRPESQPSFNLIAAQPRPGDRSRRKDDRYLFLEVLLSARQHLHLSYVGRSVRDGSKLPPSVLVSELKEYLQDRFPASAAVLETVHPLQPFSPEYFVANPALFSYSQADFQGARALGAKGEMVSLGANPLPPAPKESRSLELARLVDFFKHPAKFFCRHRLGIHLDRAAEERQDSENFSLAPLVRYQLGTDLVAALVDQPAAPDFFNLARRQGIMPHGNLGPVCYEELLAEAGRLAEIIRANGGATEEHPRYGVLELAGFTLRGQVAVRENSGQLRHRFAKLKAKDLIEAWLNHLFLNSLELDGQLRVTTLVASDRLIIFPALDDGRARLAGLLDLYWQGLRQPLPLFPESSREYYKRLSRGAVAEEALGHARTTWEGDEFQPGEGVDPYYQLCYRGLEPFDGDFPALAAGFWAPLLENCHGH